MSSSSCCAARAVLAASASPATSPRVARRASLRSCRRDARRSRARLGVVARASADDAPASSDGGDDSAGAQGSSYGAAMQNVNVAGVSLFLGMAFGPSKQLAIPHCEVPDIRWVDWAALKAAGFKACVFDKDNTLTVPYEKRVHEPIAASLRRCVDVFGAENVAVLSNSAGLTQYDPTGAVADELEAALGIGFLRHSSKKPSGSATALTERFGCDTTRMVMIGDRYLTDVVYGNRHGMLTVRCAPFTEAGESTAIKAAKWIEEGAVGWWRKAPEKNRPERTPGRKPHPLVPEGKTSGDFIASPGVW